jgi:surface polysaccharide O-acyltransferase-like enzyme
VFAAYVAVLVQAFDWMAIDLPFFWAVRDPLHWLGFYVGGWWVTRTLPPATLARLTGRRVWLAGIGAAVLLAALVLGPVGKLRPGWLRLVSAWCALLVLFVSSVGRSTDSRLIRHLSDSTYAIYLYHLFFVYPIQPFFRALPGIFEPEAVLVPWLAGVVGPLLLVAAGRALFGERSRTWLGA